MPGFVRTKAITLPSFSFKKRTTAYVKCISDIYLGKELEEIKSDGTVEKKAPAHLMKIIDLESNTLCEMIVPSLLLSTFVEKLENDFIDRCFEIIVSAQPKEGKRYKEVQVFEIEEPGDLETELLDPSDTVM